MPKPTQTEELSGFWIAIGTGVRYNECLPDLERDSDYEFCALPSQGWQYDRSAMGASTKSGMPASRGRTEALT